ncbi:28S ribosomal protein S35, mitochondrial [Chiloscyllium plagiosum]|uniref:28S ribosomal protein S35, mitochondrial n=1 Tax=Chiloscyllium plagiosum TaxID=36176 RepID=UPI001CB833D4|nr:28S ribosomal protein S35, mitochondrial [Chiloscyllium plagiosum]
MAMKCVLRSFVVRSRVNGHLGGSAFYSTHLSPTHTTSPEAVTRSKRASPKQKQRREPVPPRTEKMEVDQNWCNVYPTAAAFKPSVVPLPIRMGYPVKRGAPPAKIGNLELIKIPNFLHLTPPAIKQHCTALKGRSHAFRLCILKVRLSSLNLDDHAKKKFIKLVGNRYNKDTDILTITTDRCPLRRQNYDYAMYLLTVLYHESWKTEAWELDKTEADMDEYIWENSQSEKNALDTIFRMKKAEKLPASKEDIISSPEVHNYKLSVVNIKNEGETENSILQYKESVKKLLKLQIAA